MTIGTPVNTVVGATVLTPSMAIAIPAGVTAGRVLLVSAHGRRGSATLAPDAPTITDTSGAPLVWTPCFSPVPTQVGANPGVNGQWWWAISDGLAKAISLAFVNASQVFSSVADFSIGAGQNPGFTNQAFAGSTGTPSGAVTATLPTLPTTGINFLSFYGAGGALSTIASGYTSLTQVASTPYRTGYKTAPVQTAVMGSSFVDQLLMLANIVEVPVAGGSVLKVWNGSAMVAKPVKVWNGSSWVTKPKKVWNGSVWR